MEYGKQQTGERDVSEDAYVEFDAYCVAGRSQGIPPERLSRAWNMLAHATRCMIREDIEVYFRSEEFPVAQFLINRPGEEISTDTEEPVAEFRHELSISGIPPDSRTVRTARATSLFENYGYNYKTDPSTWTPLFRTTPPRGTSAYRAPYAINLLCLEFVIAEVSAGAIRLRDINETDLRMHARVLGRREVA